MNRARPNAPEMRAVILERQGPVCAMPRCRERWTDLAHVEPSGMGGRASTFVPSNLAGLCRPCHRIYDGQDLAGRARMLRDLFAAFLAVGRSERDLMRGDQENPGSR